MNKDCTYHRCVFSLCFILLIFQEGRTQCDFQPGSPAGGTETVCFYDVDDVQLGCSYNCQVTGQQIKCGYNTGSEPWPDYYYVTFTTLICYNADVLPVVLSSFSVESTNNGVLCSWTTNAEINNEYFELEKSTDGFEFSPITKLEGNGNSTTSRSYSFLDTNMSEGTVYYRLKQVDFDGVEEYLSTMSFLFVSKIKYRLLTSEEGIYIHEYEPIKSLTIYSLEGNMQPLIVKKNKWIQFENSGFYIIYIEYEDETTEVHKFVK